MKVVDIICDKMFGLRKDSKRIFAEIQKEKSAWRNLIFTL
jgi:hypothetical protein